ncbi:hypothetical protein HG15A2_19910 [Adhaeretor mobilis]|uniref:Uncharacterized protein n=1 Tax=Adhaeretor mobilis TaxID=1930276 RepID=A0A517MV18_9BACT|nr:hypothetical protein HG15A2_19910 [Adhaeretor mobilis]
MARSRKEGRCAIRSSRVHCCTRHIRRSQRGPSAEDNLIVGNTSWSKNCRSQFLHHNRSGSHMRRRDSRRTAPGNRKWRHNLRRRNRSPRTLDNHKWGSLRSRNSLQVLHKSPCSRRSMTSRWNPSGNSPHWTDSTGQGSIAEEAHSAQQSFSSFPPGKVVARRIVFVQTLEYHQSYRPNGSYRFCEIGRIYASRSSPASTLVIRVSIQNSYLAPFTPPCPPLFRLVHLTT